MSKLFIKPAFNKEAGFSVFNDCMSLINKGEVNNYETNN